jgi:hypothetical protein
VWSRLIILFWNSWWCMQTNLPSTVHYCALPYLTVLYRPFMYLHTISNATFLFECLVMLNSHLSCLTDFARYVVRARLRFRWSYITRWMDQRRFDNYSVTRIVGSWSGKFVVIIYSWLLCMAAQNIIIVVCKVCYSFRNIKLYNSNIVMCCLELISQTV